MTSGHRIILVVPDERCRPKAPLLQDFPTDARYWRGE
jgi:hypothetical protein